MSPLQHDQQFLGRYHFCQRVPYKGFCSSCDFTSSRVTILGETIRWKRGIMKLFDRPSSNVVEKTRSTRVVN